MDIISSHLIDEIKPVNMADNDDLDQHNGDEQREELSRHQKLLQHRCRACNELLDKRKKTYPKHTYRDIILQVFKIDIAEDDVFIHPTRFCDNHRVRFDHFKRRLNAGKTISTSVTFFDFQPHSSHCELCSGECGQSTRQEHSYFKRPARKKRKQGGRHTPLITITPAPNTVMPTTCNSASGETLENPSTPIDQVVNIFCSLSNVEKKECMDKLIASISLECKSILARKLGEDQADKIAAEAEEVSENYKDISQLTDYNVSKTLASINGVLKSFVQGCSNLPENLSTQQMYLMNLTVEMIYKLRIPSCIAPLSFMKSLMFYIGKDRTSLMQINGASCPGGSNTTVKEWLSSQATDHPVCPDGDIVTVFDNDQVIGKTYSVRPQNKVNSSIITNAAWIQLDQHGSLQKDYNLSPGKWLCDDPASPSEAFMQAVHRMLTESDEDPLFKQFKEIHERELSTFLGKAIEEVIAEQGKHSDNVFDYIDTACEALKVAQKYQTCGKCGTLVLRPRRNCTNPRCGVNLKASTATSSADQVIPNTEDDIEILDVNKDSGEQHDRPERYPHIIHNHPTEPPEITLADPIFVNPNSYETLSAVLRKIGKDAGVYRYGGTQRHWMLVCCDGLPYHLCLKLIQKTVICVKCSKSFFGEDLFIKHKGSCCPDVSSGGSFREFDWVVLKIGAGHYEMNMFKSFMELNWEPFMSDLCQLLSFRSPFAQQSAKRCDDTHKTWAIILSFHMATLKELVLGYVRTCIEEDLEATPSGYLDYADSMRHIPNFAYMHDMVCLYSQAILNFRMGIRRNNTLLVRSAKHIFKGIFHGRNHPIYSLVEINDSMSRLIAPPQVKEFMGRFESISKSGDPSSGQDFDFVIEEANQDTKSWIPRGVPDDEMWQRIIRNLPKLKWIKCKMKQLTGVSERVHGYRNLDIDSSVHAWRCRLRETEYLLKMEYNHTSTTGVPLHPQLASFRRLAEAKRDNHIKAIYLHDEEDTKPVFVTQEEANKLNSIEKATIPQIKKRIENDIATLIESEADQSYLLNKYDKVKSKRKAELVKLFYEVQQRYTEQSQPQDSTGAE